MNRPHPSTRVLNELLLLDASTGMLTWRIRRGSWFKEATQWCPKAKRQIVRSADAQASAWNKTFAETVAGNVDSKSGYRTIKIRDTKFRAHRVAWAMHFGEWPFSKIGLAARARKKAEIKYGFRPNHGRTA